MVIGEYRQGLKSESFMAILNAYKSYTRDSNAAITGLNCEEVEVYNLIVNNASIKNSCKLSDITGLPICMCADIVLVSGKRSKAIHVCENNTVKPSKPKRHYIKNNTGSKNVKNKMDVTQALKLVLHGLSTNELESMGVSVDMRRDVKRFLRSVKTDIDPQNLIVNVNLEKETVLKMLDIWNKHNKRWGLKQ